MKRDLRSGFARRRFGVRRAWILLSYLAIAFSFFTASSLPTVVAAQSVIRVSNDPGGSLTARLAQIRELRQTGRRVEIRNGYCHSACTLYLGLPNTCVSPNVTLGFHGPQVATRGLGMLPDQFESWSVKMSEHYPGALKEWFMTSARYSKRLILVRGDQLIALGIPKCS